MSAPLKLKLTESQRLIVEAAMLRFRSNGWPKAEPYSLDGMTLTMDAFDFASLLDHVDDNFGTQLEIRRIRALALSQIMVRKSRTKKDSSLRHYQSMELLIQESEFGKALVSDSNQKLRAQPI
jgi:hypothetical protein